MEPWGSPIIIGKKLDSASSRTTFCHLQLKLDCSMDTDISSKPWSLIFSSASEWDNVHVRKI